MVDNLTPGVVRAQAFSPSASFEIRIVTRQIIPFHQLNSSTRIPSTDVRIIAQYKPVLPYLAVAEERFCFNGFQCGVEHT